MLVLGAVRASEVCIWQEKPGIISWKCTQNNVFAIGLMRGFLPEEKHYFKRFQKAFAQLSREFYRIKNIMLKHW
jgi:hypothetical protein